MSRDAVARIVNSPWVKIVTFAALGGFAYSDLRGDMDDLTEGRAAPMIEMQRSLDSLRIETRHIGQTVDEIRHLLGRLR